MTSLAQSSLAGTQCQLSPCVLSMCFVCPMTLGGAVLFTALFLRGDPNRSTFCFSECLRRGSSLALGHLTSVRICAEKSAVSVATYTREVLRCVGPESGDKTCEKRAAGFGAAKIERISAAALPASLAELLSRA